MTTTKAAEYIKQPELIKTVTENNPLICTKMQLLK